MKKYIKRFMLFILTFTFVITGVNIANASQEGITSKRIAGSDRIETSIQISQMSYDRNDTAILTGVNGTVDALSGSILSHNKKAPQLLTHADKIDTNLKNEFKRLGVKKIYLLGGDSVISKKVEGELKKNYTVERISGKDRYATAIEIANKLNYQTDEIFVVNGYDGIADALAIGPVSAKLQKPILLVNKNNIPKDTLNKIKKDKPSKVTIVGGTAVVNQEVENELKSHTQVDRVYGKDRNETSVKIAQKYYDANVDVILANGHTHADALSGGYYASLENEPILLTNSDRINKGTFNFIQENNSNITVLGGDNAISEKLIQTLIETINKGDGYIDETIEEDKSEPVPPINKDETIEEDKSEPVPPINKGDGNADETIEEDKSEPVPPVKTTKVNNKTELRNEFIRNADKRADSIVLNYRGNDLKTRHDVLDFMDETMASGSYHFSNLSQFTAYDTIKKDDGIEIKVELVYRTTDEEEAFIDKEVSRIIKENTNSKMNEFQKVRAIHDYIVDTKIYTTNTKTSPYSPYTFFKEGKGVCNSYTLAFSRILDKLGIDNMFVRGVVKEEGDTNWGYSHSWNKVKVDNTWYNVDVTWNHPKAKFGLHNAYKYFMNSDARFYKDHKPENGAVLPSSNDKSYDGQFDGNFNRK